MLDHYVLEATPSWQRRALMITSVVLHAAAATGLIIWSVIHVEELVPPDVTLTFFSSAPPPPPPPPPPPAAATKPKAEPVKVKVVNPNPTLIDPTPKPIEKEEPKEEPAGEPGGVVGGVAGGVVGGVLGGVVGAAPAAAPPPPAAPAARKMVASFVFDQQRLQSPDPHLPSDFVDRHAKQAFSATYRICVGTDGHVTDVGVIRGVAGLDDSILDQLKRTWVYRPQPLPVCSVRNFVFKIN